MSEKESNTLNKDREKSELCTVEIHETRNIMKECNENGYGAIDVMTINVEEPRKIGDKREEESTIKPQGIAEINPKEKTIRYVKGETKAAEGIEKAPTTEEIKAQKEAQKAGKNEGLEI